jgi:hypothetical protein
MYCNLHVPRDVPLITHEIIRRATGAAVWGVVVKSLIALSRASRGKNIMRTADAA